MGVAGAVVVETNGSTAVVDAEQLVDRRLGLVLGREVDLVIPAVRAPEAEVAVVGGIAVVLPGEEADTDPLVVGAGNLRLGRSGEILAAEIALRVGCAQGIAFIRVPGVAAAVSAGMTAIPPGYSRDISTM